MTKKEGEMRKMVQQRTYDLRSPYRKRVDKRNAYICKAFRRMCNEYPVASPTAIMEALAINPKVCMTRQGVANILRKNNIYPISNEQQTKR